VPPSPALSYRGLPLDRAHTRRPGADLSALAAEAGARIVPFWRGLSLVAPAPAARLLCPPVAALGTTLAADPAVPWALLGLDSDGPVLGVDLSAIEADESGPDLGLDGAVWVAPRAVAAVLPEGESALLGYLRGLMLWRGRTRFCPACGAALRPEEGGHVLRCTDPACAQPQFPRTDPAVIALVTDPEGRALLGRQPGWAPGLFSCLAGFVEPGESLEEAVAREVFEESAIRVSDVRYAASQPWPFPASLMIGFTARAEGGEPRPAAGEIEDVCWVSRDEAAAFGEPGAPGPDGRLFPGRDSIARALIETWRAG